MFLKSPLECIKVTTVNDCVTYDSRATQTVCVEC